MKSCEYCGRENEDAFQFCVDCRTPFASPKVQQPRLRPETQVSLKIIDPVAIADAFSIAEGFTRAEWWHNATEAAGTIVHELTHDSLAHLRLPLWLNEGVAETLARAVAPPRPSVSQSIQDSLFASAIGWKPPIIWDELAERHSGWWDSERIQAFWAGTSFYEPGDASELSYSLAAVLVNLASEKANPESFRGCLNASLQEDAGQDAFQQILGLDLGELAGKFLGPGKWRPERLCMKRLWQAAGWTGSPEP